MLRLRENFKNLYDYRIPCLPAVTIMEAEMGSSSV